MPIPKRVEVAEIVSHCIAEVGREQNMQFAFLTVSHDYPFKLFDTEQPGVEKAKGRKGEFVPERGTAAQLGRFTRLLCVNGPRQIKRPTAPLPHPLLIHLRQERCSHSPESAGQPSRAELAGSPATVARSPRIVTENDRQRPGTSTGRPLR